MRRVNSRGIDQATKNPSTPLWAGVLMAALTYNASAMLSAGLKKYLKWTGQKPVVKVMERQVPLNRLKNTLKGLLNHF